jgi:GNAT superfamily N-acetyltransferase
MATTGDTIEPGGLRTGLDSLMIERATPAHVPYLRRLKESVMTSRYLPAGDREGFDRWREVYCTDAYFTELINNPDELLLCIGSLREPVGMVVLRRTSDHLEIDDLLCLHARRGDGTRLLRAALQYAEVWRIGRVMIDIYPGHQNAERFLEAHGFQRTVDSSNDLGEPMHRYERTVS